MKQYLDLRSELDLRGSKVRWGQWGGGGSKRGDKKNTGECGGGGSTGALVLGADEAAVRLICILNMLCIHAKIICIYISGACSGGAARVHSPADYGSI